MKLYGNELRGGVGYNSLESVIRFDRDLDGHPISLMPNAPREVFNSKIPQTYDLSCSYCIN